MTVIEVELVASTGLSVEARFEHYCYLLSFRVLHELLMNDPTMHCNRQSYLTSAFTIWNHTKCAVLQSLAIFRFEDTVDLPFIPWGT